jgi:hypothetical protein
MSTDETTRQNAGLLGVGAAACVACCAGPLIGFLAAASVATLTTVAVFGVAGLAVPVLAVLAYLRRRRAAPDSGAAEAVPVVLGRRPDA